MRNTLEDFYYPGKQQMAPNSELKRAKEKLTTLEDKAVQEWLIPYNPAEGCKLPPKGKRKYRR